MADLMILRDGVLQTAFPEHPLLSWDLRRSKAAHGKNSFPKKGLFLQPLLYDPSPPPSMKNGTDYSDSLVRKRLPAIEVGAYLRTFI